MDRLNEYLPENCYKPENMSMEDIKKAFNTGKTVVGRVTAIDEVNKVLNVKLGDKITATLPFNEVTIYPFTYSKRNPHLTLPQQILCLRNKVICAKITNISKQDNIVLSRKLSMLEAFEKLKAKEFLPFTVTDINDTFVYGDVGYGLSANIYIRNLCTSTLLSATEICQKGDSFYIKVLKTNESKKFDVSYKETFPAYNPADYKRGDILTVRVKNPSDDSLSGYYAYITPQVTGIIDNTIFMPPLNYGDEVECYISKPDIKGLRLKFIRFIKRSEA